MATTVPVVGQTFSFDIQLRSQADANLFQTNPTLAAADFRISINGGAYDTLDNPPTVSPAGGDQVVIVVSAAENTAAGAGGRWKVDWKDAAGDEWYPDYACGRVHAAEIGAAVHLDPTQGAVEFGQVKITADVAGQGALHVVNANATGNGIEATGGGNGLELAGTTDNGLHAEGGQHGAYLAGAAGHGLDAVGLIDGIYAEGDTHGMRAVGGVDGMQLNGTTGYGLQAAGGTAATDPLWATAALVWAYGARTLTSFGTLAATIAAAVWDRLTTALTTAGSIGKLLVEKLALITAGSVQVTVTGPVVEGGNVVTYRGDSYQNADGRALDWESTEWPNLTGATVAVIIGGVASFTGSVVTPTGTAKVRLELTGTQSASIDAGRHNFQIVATKSGKAYTLVAAAWVSRARAEV